MPFVLVIKFKMSTNVGILNFMIRTNVMLTIAEHRSTVLNFRALFWATCARRGETKSET